MQVRANHILSVAVFLILFANFAYAAKACTGTSPPCSGLGIDKECNDPTTEICTEGSSGKCECIATFCPAPGERTYINALYINENNWGEGDLDVELYFIEPDAATGKGVVMPVEGGLIIINSGRYVTRSSTYAPFSKEKMDNKVCKAFTNSKGEVNIKLEHPPGGMRITHGIIFCPYVNSSAAGRKDLAICARLLDENGNLHESIDYTDIVDCDDSWSADVSEDVLVKGISKKIWDGLAPAETSVSASNDGPSSAEVTFCWALALVFGLLLSASFTAGKNPLMFFDLNSARSIRMNRTAGQYQPMNQMVSINIEAALNTAYSAVKTGIAAFSEGAVATNDEGNVVDGNGNEINGADGMPLKLDANGDVVNNSGEKVGTDKNGNLVGSNGKVLGTPVRMSLLGSPFGSRGRMDAGYKGSKGGIRGELTSLAGKGLGKLGVGSDGSAWGNITKDVAAAGLVGLVEGAIAGIGGGGLGGAVKAMGKGSINSGKQLLKAGIVEGLGAIAPMKDTSDEAPGGGAGVDPKQAANELKNETVRMLGLSEKQAENLEIQKINNPDRTSYYRVKGKKGSDVEKVKAYFGQSGLATFADKSGVLWSANALMGEDGKLLLSGKNRSRQVDFGQSGGYQIINGIVMKTGGGGAYTIFEHIAEIGDSMWQATFNEGSGTDVLNAFVMPIRGLVSVRGMKEKYRVSNSSREFNIGDTNYTITGNQVMSGSASVGTFSNGKITLNSNGNSYKLDNDKVLDVTNEEQPNPRIMPNVESTNMFTLNGNDFSAKDATSAGDGTVQNIVELVQDAGSVRENVVATIHRDVNGNISEITDKNGNEINNLNVDGVEFSMRMGISAVGRGSVEAGNLGKAEPLIISNVGQVSNASAEGWTSDIANMDGKAVKDENNKPVETLKEAYMVELRRAFGLQKGNPVGVAEAQQAISEHQDIQKRLAAASGINISETQSTSDLFAEEIRIRSELPKGDRWNHETDKILEKNYTAPKDMETASKLAQTEGLIWIAQREENANKLANLEGGEYLMRKEAGGEIANITDYERDARKDIVGVQLDIAKKYENIAEKIAGGKNVAGEMTELKELKTEHAGYVNDLKTYDAAGQTTMLAKEASVKSELGTWGLKSEFEKLNKHIANSVNEYNDGDDKAQNQGKMKYMMEGVVKLNNCNSKGEAKELLGDMNHILSGGEI